MQNTFSDVVTTEEQLREILGHPAPLTVAKAIPTLDEHCRAFIAKSPFMLIASADANGNMDVSPKGDPSGFVQVLDDNTLAIPDRLGNRRADTFKNILQNPKVALLFLVPGKQETLRVSGTAMIVRDEWLRERMVVQGKMPNFAIVVNVEEAFIHCAKCVIRSKMWDATQWPETDDLASIARVLVDHTRATDTVEQIQVVVDESYRNRLY
ncbi:MAG: pyridoxamine 5'-phosphate oxidase family protein [Burkholderiales bacterium]|nr:pyridoxamine 5'-phosphate oxidase family protein [Anaerolineae bacterium]